MQVLWLSHVVPYPPKAGVLLRAYYLMRSIAQRHELDLVAFVQEPLLRTFYPTMEQALEDCRRELEKVCRSVTFLPISKLQRPFGKPLTALQSLVGSHGYMASWLDSPEARTALARQFQQRSYDLAHFDCISLACFRPLLGDIPVTLGHHNAESHMMLRRAENESSLLRKAYFFQEGKRLARFESQVADDFAAQITCSDLDSERLRTLMPRGRFITVPNGVDVDFFKPQNASDQSAPQKPGSLMFISSMTWYPNVTAALFLLKELWPAILAKTPTATLEIVGAGAPASVVEAAQALRGVTLHGFVPEIRPLMESAALFICPIRDGGGTKLKVLDAFAMEKCMVAHPIACEGIQVTPGKNVVFASTPDEFATQVCALLEDPERRQRIGKAARELAVGSYSFEAIGKRFAESLESLRNAAPSLQRTGSQ